MRTEVKNISQLYLPVYSAYSEAKVLVELMFTRILGLGKVVLLVVDLLLLMGCLCLSGVVVKEVDWTFSKSYLSGMAFLFYLLFGLGLFANRAVLLGISKHYKDNIGKKRKVFIVVDSSSCVLLERYIEENRCDFGLRGSFNNIHADVGNATEGSARGDAKVIDSRPDLIGLWMPRYG